MEEVHSDSYLDIRGGREEDFSELINTSLTPPPFISIATFPFSSVATSRPFPPVSFCSVCESFGFFVLFFIPAKQTIFCWEKVLPFALFRRGRRSLEIRMGRPQERTGRSIFGNGEGRDRHYLPQ
ncbi:hypothetical protein CDAR_375831 [Caerostris darwini]|uniref:Uncharacterized protein n=1 Tax=Caerostris darwini TaxID=1538125 RepID=A0AAV4S9Z8_9ARAC|nr:hypothetical protein CDAR_375831 [Caerostris darwini]